MAILFCLFLQLLIPFTAHPFSRVFASTPEGNALSPPVNIMCSANTFYKGPIKLTFQANCLTDHDTSLLQLFDGSHITQTVNVSTGSCTEEAELTVLSQHLAQQSKMNTSILKATTTARGARPSHWMFEPVPEEVASSPTNTIICLENGPDPKTVRMSFQTACLNPSFASRENSTLARNSDGTYNISAIMEVAHENCTNWDDQVKIETELELIELTLQETNRQHSEKMQFVTDGMNVADYQSQTEILQKQLELVDFASNIESALQVIQPAATIANFIFSHIMPSELILITDLIQVRFNQINEKMDKLLDNLNDMETNIKASIALNTFMSTYINWEYAIRNGMVKLRDIRQQLGQTQDKRRQKNLALDYIMFHDNNQLEGKMINLYRIAVTAKNPTNRNLFELFINQHSCDVNQLSGLMIILKGLMTSAAQQTLTYYYFKGEKTRGKSWYEKIRMYLYEIRQEFQKRVYSCKKNSIDNAKNEVVKILEKNFLPMPEVLVQLILQRLTNLFPWYAWGVAEFQKIGGPSCNSELEIKGSNYFTVKNYGEQTRNILVTWQDAKQLLSCSDISQVKTLVPYQRCDMCNNNHVAASQNILTQNDCPHSLNLQCSRNNLNVMEQLHWDWIAVDAEAHSDRCHQWQACSGHGSCFSVPGTNQFMCICRPLYEGKICGKKIISNNRILNHMTTLRTEFMTANGVPTVVDIYFELQHGLKTSLNNLKDAVSHTQALVKHSDILYKASYIVQLFLDLRQGKINLDTFAEMLETFLKVNSENYIIFRLRGILLSDGIADVEGEDFFNTFKKSYASKYTNACTQTYFNVVNNLKTNLAYLDEAVGEAFLMLKHWRIEKGDSTAMRGLESFVENFKTRQKKYHIYWKRTSCPSLTVPNLIQNYCTEELSYENMEVNLSCSDHKVPSPSSVRCVRKQGELVWSAIPKCSYQWAAWGSWSACPHTCGSGKQYRTRRCTGHETHLCGPLSRQEKVCNNGKCCLSSDGNYKCSNGQCILQSQLCDGNNDCWTGEDESRLKCPQIIQSGDTIALKSSCTEDHWVSCYCQYCPLWYKCKVHSCPGLKIESDEWDHGCLHERFTIKSLRDGPIRHGDEIAIYSQAMAEWLSCEPGGRWCKTRTCPGSIDRPRLHSCTWERFIIFSAARKGRCSSDTFSLCIGDNIHHGDIVFIKSAADSRQWLSEDFKSIRTGKCPGKYIPAAKTCPCKSWKIFKRY
ncbi:SE-cephalotoxin-like [Heterodontus francisci]|uniref:SE-cephalotoxin-like n=1 Tax=Heterodontus francisci TaxID=7792 RepID=UPI00355C698E